MKGSYTFILETPQEAEIGAIGEKKFEKRYAAYNGSAFGPGGLKRVLRHFSRDKNVHWHIDYLTSGSRPVKAYLYPGRDIECRLSSEMSDPVQGFGSSDCSCSSHLFQFEDPGSVPVLSEVKVLDQDRYRQYKENGQNKGFDRFIGELPEAEPDQQG